MAQESSAAAAMATKFTSQKPGHYLWATLHYICEQGHHNSLNKFFLCSTNEVSQSDVLPYLPRQWHCALCGDISPPSVEVLFHWMTASQWAALNIDERSSAVILPLR
jgi:hypothetical protein